MTMKDSSMVAPHQFKVGDIVVISADVSRQGSVLDGLHGTVTEMYENYVANPSCSVQQQDKKAAPVVAVQLAFGEFHDRKGYRHLFAEHEIKVTPLEPQRTRLEVVAEAEGFLEDYNRGHLLAAKQGGVGLGGGISGNEFADGCNSTSRRLLRGAIQALLAPGNGGCCDRVTLGICAQDAEEGVQVLKRWVTALDLPRGALHGMDRDGTAIRVDGPVYIKYNSGTRTFEDVRSNGGVVWRPGDAFLNKYEDGDYRGVGFVAHLPRESDNSDSGEGGTLRQCAYLPLDLF
jgi:hypothetical protein